MKLKNTLFFALTIFAFASCNKEVPGPGLQQPEPLGSGISITATIGSETRTSVVYGNTDNTAGETSEWVAGDIIHLYFYDSGDNLAGNLYFKANSGGPTSTFTLETSPDAPILAPSAPPNDNTYRVVAAYCEGNFINFDVATQVGTSTSHIGRSDPMKAELSAVTIDANGNADLNLSFEHLAAMLRFSVTNSTGEEIAIQGIDIRSSSAANQFNYNADYNTNHVFTPNQVTESLQLTCQQSIVGGGESAHFYRMVSGNMIRTTAADFVVTVKYYSAGSNKTQEFRIPMSANAFLQTPFEGGKRYYFNLNITGANIIGETVGNLRYEINTTKQIATVVGCTDGTTAVHIPATIPYGGDSYDVVAIGDMAFFDEGLTSLTFASPSKLTTIGMRAFYGCSDLVGDITIPASVTSIGRYAFSETALTIVAFETNSNLTHIGAYAFANNSSMNSNFTIPASVTFIDEFAFYTTGLTGVFFGVGSQLTFIGRAAFSNNASLVGTISLPDLVTFIGTDAFSGVAISALNLHPIVPPTVAAAAFRGLSGITLNVGMSAGNNYNTVLNNQEDGWVHSNTEPFTIGGTPVLFPDLAGGYNITVAATL